MSLFLTPTNSQEKIKSRAERFGGFQSDDAKKAARAAKFGDMLGKQVVAAAFLNRLPKDLDLNKNRGQQGRLAVLALMLMWIC